MAACASAYVVMNSGTGNNSGTVCGEIDLVYRPTAVTAVYPSVPAIVVFRGAYILNFSPR